MTTSLIKVEHEGQTYELVDIDGVKGVADYELARVLGISRVRDVRYLDRVHFSSLGAITRTRSAKFGTDGKPAREHGREVMADLDVAGALELADRHKIRPLIIKYRSELGEVSARQAALLTACEQNMDEIKRALARGAGR